MHLNSYEILIVITRQLLFINFNDDGGFMTDLYIPASIPDQGKTVTSILLEKKLRSEGKRVACLQTANKDPNVTIE